MARVLVPLAEGFEELEAVTVVDLLRRAGIEVVTAGLTAGPVTGSHGITLQADATLDDVITQAFDMIILPGGLPGATHLGDDERLLARLRQQAAARRQVAAICAAPAVLAKAGLLDGRRATSYPGFLGPDSAPGLVVLDEPVVTDGLLVTSRGPGTAMDFALVLIERLAGAAMRNTVESRLQRPAAAPLGEG